MMKRILTLIIILLFSISSLSQTIPEANRKEILKTLEEQRASWNLGDIDGYMQGYWQSDSLRFISKSGITYCWNETLTRYKKAYPTRESMGNLTFEVISLQKLNNNSAFMIGKWTLKFNDKTVFGSFSLILKKIGKKWLVAVDHSS